MQVFKQKDVELTVLQLQSVIDQQTLIVSVAGVDIVISLTGVGFVNVHEAGNYKNVLIGFDKQSQTVRRSEVDSDGCERQTTFKTA